MESLLEALPGAIVSCFLSREALRCEVGVQQSLFCPVEGGPSFYVKPKSEGPSGIDDMHCALITERW